jgi:hypothetical protein
LEEHATSFFTVEEQALLAICFKLVPLLVLFLDLEDGATCSSEKFFRFSKDYAALYPRR